MKLTLAIIAALTLSACASQDVTMKRDTDRAVQIALASE